MTTQPNPNPASTTGELARALVLVADAFDQLLGRYYRDLHTGSEGLQIDLDALPLSTLKILNSFTWYVDQQREVLADPAVLRAIDLARKVANQ